MNIEFFDGIPEEDGYYFVKLDLDTLPCSSKPYDVDYCRAKSKSDGCGREWVHWYAHNIEKWAHLPKEEEK